MASNNDWLPSNHEALYNMAKQAKTYITTTANRTRMGFATNTPQGQWLDTTFTPLYTAFITAFEAWQNPATRTQMMTVTLVDAQKTFTEAFRKLYTGFLKDSPIVTDADLVAMGMPPHSSGGHTPAPVPTTIPEAEVLLPAPGVVEVHFHDSGAENKAKPAGVHGAEIAWAVLDEPPVEWAQLIHSSFDTHTPFTLSFEGNDRARHLYFALRWENTRGDKGPWSAIQDVVIP
jgi:hypothetical protein